MVPNKLCRDRNNAVGLPKQRNSYQSSPTFFCIASPTVLFAFQHNLFPIMRPDRAKHLSILQQFSHRHSTQEVVRARENRIKLKPNICYVESWLLGLDGFPEMAQESQIIYRLSKILSLLILQPISRELINRNQKEL